MLCTVTDIRGDYAYVRYDDTGVVSEVAIALLPWRGCRRSAEIRKLRVHPRLGKYHNAPNMHAYCAYWGHLSWNHIFSMFAS